MSIKKKDQTERKESRPSQAKQERYIQPSLLLGLLPKASYGYELIRDIQRFGFVEGQAPPGMIYRHLRQLEQDGLVSSEWQTEGAGPAKRMYYITEEGRGVLAVWIDYMQRQVKNLTAFIRIYEGLLQKEKPILRSTRSSFSSLPTTPKRPLESG